MQKQFFGISLLLVSLPLINATSQTILPVAQNENKLIAAATQNIIMPAQAPKSRTITIKNGIKPEMLIYKKHWSGSYEPKPFEVIIDGKKLEQGASTEVAIADNKIAIQYSYSFMMGYRKGTDEVTFTIPEKQDTLQLTFSWDDDFRLKLDHGAPKKRVSISEKEKITG